MKTIFLNVHFRARGVGSKMTNILGQKSQYLENKNFSDNGAFANRFPVKFCFRKSLVQKILSKGSSGSQKILDSPSLRIYAR